ncbi:MAG: response regulator transcription factor [Burkholderiales bacterium]|jgi:DNA-binding response OmpR family regulator|nr:response regulator transcription factor [Burkholderiales bacterium]
MRLLIIEDNPDLAANLLEFLADRGHTVDVAGDGLTGLHLATVNDYDAIVLDLMLPGMDGITLCRKLREEAQKTTPVLIVTARDALDDKIVGLESGADDYVVKPFALREVEARLKALARRAQGQGLRTRLQVGDLSFDTDTLKISRGQRAIQLPPIPLRLLETLMRHSPRVLSRSELEHAIWGDTPPDSDALRAHMHLLRRAIDAPGERPLLHTVRGLGYQLAEEDAASSAPSP